MTTVHVLRQRYMILCVFFWIFSVIVTTTDAFLTSRPRPSIQSQQTSFQKSTSRSLSIPLFAVAKSGGKMIVTEEMFKKNVLSKNIPRPVLVFFSAPWCGPCRLTNPVVKEVMKQYSGDIDVVEVCTDDLAEIAEQSGIVSIPTIQFYYGGKPLETIVGCVAKSVLSAAVDKVLEDIEQTSKRRP